MKKNSKQITLTSIAALGAAGSAYGGIAHIAIPVTLNNDGDVWYLEGSAGSTKLALFGTAVNTVNGTSSRIYASFPARGSNASSVPRTNVFNGFRMAETGSIYVRNLSAGAFVTSGLFSGENTFGSRYGFIDRDDSPPALKQAWKHFSLDTSAYIGFQFNTGSGVRYGWANVTWQNNGDLIINEWAYADVDDGKIQVGAVPEPATSALGLGLLALGAAGMRRYKRKAA